METFDEKTSSKIKDQFVEFLKMFKENGQLKYRRLISLMPSEGKRSIVISFQDLLASDIQLAIDLQKRPSTYIPILSDALVEVLTIEDPSYAERQKLFIHARITDLTDETALKNLNYEQLGLLSSTNGMVTRSSELIPLPVIQAYKCTNEHLAYIPNSSEDLKVRPPLFCSIDRCDSTTFREDNEKSIYADFQTIRIQEPTEDMAPGQLPHFVDVNLSFDLVKSVMPGDRVKIVGYLEVYQESKNAPSKRYRLHCVSIEAKTTMSSPEILTPEETISLQEFAARPGSYERLVYSIAPSIYGHLIEKEACFLLMIGAPAVTLDEGIRLRGNINVLIAGDPGISKTSLLTYTAKIAPRGIYTNAKTSSAAGLTAAVVRDKNNMFVLEAGATVLGDLGVTAIDEMSRSSEEDRDALHEVMEQNTVSIAKGGFVATLNARTSVLAATNPVFGKYDPYKNLIQNLSDFPIPLLNRFDLIFIVRDVPDKEIDSKIADHILSVRARGKLTNTNVIQSEFLRKYIAYAKTMNPELTEDVRDLLKKEYLRMRLSTAESDLPYNPRFLESMIRLSIARARALLHQRVSLVDASRAIDLVKKSLESALIDTKTKKVDLGMLYGKSASERSLLETALEVSKQLEGTGQIKQAVNDGDFIQALVKTGKFNDEEAGKMLKTLYRSGQIYMTAPHFYRKI